MKKNALLIFCLILFRANAQQVLPGIEQVSKYLPYIEGKNIGITCNHSTIFVNHKHLIDSLLTLNIKVKKIFVPEHGFRGEVAAGELVAHSTDEKTGIPIISLYGKNKKPQQEDLQGIEVMLFDIQDVGVRFYTYISTLHYVMEACAENNIPLIVLDRPNPLGFYVDGPVLDTAYRSFVGMHPVPIVYGMTIGEYAQMINGEGWLKNSIKCNLMVVPVENYSHSMYYPLPVKPSPALVNRQAVLLYPSLCLFEGTVIQMGRGTDYPFQVVGHPLLKDKYSFSFEAPVKLGNKNLLYSKNCYGLDLRNSTDTTFTLKFLLELYRQYPNKKEFFNSFFIKLIGNKAVYQAIVQGKGENEIRQLWKDDVEKFKLVRQKYLLYRD